jgi:hypothetical protein
LAWSGSIGWSEGSRLGRLGQRAGGWPVIEALTASGLCVLLSPLVLYLLLGFVFGAGSMFMRLFLVPVSLILPWCAVGLAIGSDWPSNPYKSVADGMIARVRDSASQGRTQGSHAT